MKYSVILPVYNAEATLSRCLDSLVNQGFSDYEILLINDGSTDGSDAICRQYADTYKQIRYFFLENKGVSSTRNLGLHQAKGDYILFVDSDDYVSDNYFDAISNAMEVYQPDLLLFGYCNFGGTSTLRTTGAFSEREEGQIAQRVSTAMRQYLFSSLWNKAFKRQIIRQQGLRFAEDLSIGEDQVFIFTYAMYIQSIASIEDLLYNVDVSDNNSLSRKARPYLTEQLMKVNRSMYETYRRGKHSQEASQCYEGALSWVTYRSAYSCCKELRKFGYSEKQRRLEIRKICSLYCKENIRPIGWKCKVIALPVRMRWSRMIDWVISRKTGR